MHCAVNPSGYADVLLAANATMIGKIGILVLTGGSGRSPVAPTTRGAVLGREP